MSEEKTKLERLQDGALGIALGCLFLGVLAGGGCSPIPTGATAAAPYAHPVVFALGVFGGLLMVRRRREVDLWRWQMVGDVTLTDGERQYVHKEAERRIRWATTVFLMAPVGLGCWLAYQLRDPSVVSVADLLVVTPGFGFLIGLLWETSRDRRQNSD